MSIVQAVSEREERPAFVRFKRVAIENKVESLKQGKYVGTDVDYALITPMYSKDVIEIKVESWFPQLDIDAKKGRIPQAWVDAYRKHYQAWKNGQELPPTGTAIRTWGMLTPAQVEALVRINILTVEDLAGVNDEGMKRIGMGAVEMKNKARAWLMQVNDKGPLTQENAALKRENDSLRGQVTELTRQNAELRAMLEVATAPPGERAVQAAAENEITASDLLGDDEPPQAARKRK